MKRVIGTALFVLALAGCSSVGSDAPEEIDSNQSVYEQHIVLEDGREVVCLIFREPYKGGIDCDWTNAQ